MFFVCNNSLLFDPEARAISLIGQPESVLILSVPAARLLQEFIRHKGRALSREELITRVWEEFGFTPSGNNLNKAISELRKVFQKLDEHHDYILTVPRYGFRFDTEVSCQPREKEQAAILQPQQPPSVAVTSARSWRISSLKGWIILAVFTTASLDLGPFFSWPDEIIVPTKLKTVEEKIAGCRIWLINESDRPLELSKVAELLRKNDVPCERKEYNIYYFSTHFSLNAADEVFIGACPLKQTSLCKTIRFKNGTKNEN
ncbi:Transcriptional activator CadC [Cedecea lapagei]|uniref:Transcriptional activator CadC n=1 Tax=Cedecea lapagei TaxID=158823 RepID=A0A447V463_9ENTR|nr:winged helix-turn-helix domain-containing protein [Cedecea lapagei]VEB99018.1 Transcriptional activator CadC [Cedecea lapagei]